MYLFITFKQKIEKQNLIQFIDELKKLMFFIPLEINSYFLGENDLLINWSNLSGNSVQFFENDEFIILESGLFSFLNDISDNKYTNLINYIIENIEILFLN